MTLLITIFAAIVTTIAWYVNFESGMKLGTLCLIYWGAALMWLVDAIAGYIKLGAAYFKLAAKRQLSGPFGCGIGAYHLAVLLIKDPQGRAKAVLMKNITK